MQWRDVVRALKLSTVVVIAAALLAGCGKDDAPASPAAPAGTATVPTTPGTTITTAITTTTTTPARTATAPPAGTPQSVTPTLTRCSTPAFLVALRADVDQLPFRVEQSRCTHRYARTRFVIAQCLPEQPQPRGACERTKVAAWRLGAKRWQLITYADHLDCAEIRRSEPAFPGSLCD
jgi:hypothetical protein